ncbi:MAG: nucleotide sugar dehydrogenase [Actinobacteria bacterium]|nr:nucleotide sugar dehydrogenase [Actinomycetota bacterium]MBM3697044.1 nucleotide sugar dehydrogenase [Actinomycetota bacterium]
MSTPSPRIGVIGLGYVGLPLAVVFAEAGVPVVGLDVVDEKIAAINHGTSHIEDVPSDRLAPLVESGMLRASTDLDELSAVQAIVICLPTPLDEHREPDLSAVLGAARDIAPRLQRGQLVVLESTTYPGTTREELAPLLEECGLRAGEDFHLAFSPERVDPGREDWTTRSTPKVVGGLTPACTATALQVYGQAFDTLVPVSTPEVAEMTKILENVFRSVNIALVNETAILCDRMGVDVWEVIDAAATKPFGYMPFRPGPGLGGHCIPIDPFYLTWKAREYDFHTEFIELAGKINSQMPYFCVSKLARALNDHEKALKGAKVLVVGVAYKADVNDMRESPALKVMSLLVERGAELSYHDPHVPALEPGHGIDIALRSVDLTDEALADADAVVVVTAHAGIDWQRVADGSRLVVDFRNAVPRGENVWTL